MSLNDGLNPDDECKVCGQNRDAHGDTEHAFSEDGQLRRRKPAVPARQDPPMERGEGNDRRIQLKPTYPLEQAFATLMEVLAEKDILTAPEVVRIFSGRG